MDTTGFEDVARFSREDYGSYLFVKGGAEDEILALYGVEPSSFEEKSITDFILDEDGPRNLISIVPEARTGWYAVGEHGLDNIGWRILPRASAGRTALLLNFSEVRPQIRIATDGEIVRELDPTISYRAVGALPEESGLRFGSPDSTVDVFRFIELLTGHRMTPQWMFGPFLVAVVNSPPWVS